MPRNDPHGGFRFRLEIDGIQQGQFQEVSGLEAEVEVIEYRTGAEPTHVRKLAGLTKFANVTLKWGITDSTELHDWFRQVVDGEVSRRNVTIRLQDKGGNDVAAWELVEAWPCKMSGPTLDAAASEVAIETLELCHEGWRRVQ